MKHLVNGSKDDVLLWFLNYQDAAEQRIGSQSGRQGCLKQRLKKAPGAGLLLSSHW